MRFRKIFALLLIPSLLWAGMGFSLSRHFCMDLLVDEYFYFAKDSCEMAFMEEVDCQAPEEQSSWSDKDCCRNEWIQICPVDTLNQEQKSSQLILDSPWQFDHQETLVLVWNHSEYDLAEANIPGPPDLNLSRKFRAQIQRYQI
ncbi:HYC_CC_PP family protein [Croceimicrobium sp.]|uniref:HYC_CC_PP family protein n=1 Tax=Croceimicrobium sp. TaxID=2828340 RepID=UPI003BAD35D1